MDKINEVRTNMPVEDHRRNDLYLLCEPLNFKVGDAELDGSTFMFGDFENSGRTIIFQSALSFVIVNKKPVLPGHLLVIPKRRSARRMKDLNPAEVQDLFNAAIEAQKLSESYFNGTSSTISVQGINIF